MVSLGCYVAIAALTIWHIDALWRDQVSEDEDGMTGESRNDHSSTERDRCC